MSMTRKHHIAVARGIQATQMDWETRQALCLNILEEIKDDSKGLDRELFVAYSFLPESIAEDIGE